ncbi:MAG: hypothetical protein LBG19_12590 [Prevotellaceae bacterium]|nr:hypothetical protein [Prevotellaceae bacterium]
MNRYILDVVHSFLEFTEIKDSQAKSFGNAGLAHSQRGRQLYVAYDNELKKYEAKGKELEILIKSNQQNLKSLEVDHSRQRKQYDQVQSILNSFYNKILTNMEKEQFAKSLYEAINQYK